MAFALEKYVELLKEVRSKGYHLLPIRAYFENPEPPFVLLRHDVDRFAERAKEMALAESSLKICSTYYFRVDQRGHFPAQIMKEISELGHEVGYHYEVVVKAAGDMALAQEIFLDDLRTLRQISKVETVSAHGSPLSKFSNDEILKELNLAKHGLKGDANLNLDFTEMLYITDTGGRFGAKSNRRDHVKGRNLPFEAGPKELATFLAPATEPKVVLSCHPERWPSKLPGIIQQTATDCAVNIAKSLITKMGGQGNAH